MRDTNRPYSRLYADVMNEQDTDNVIIKQCCRNRDTDIAKVVNATGIGKCTFGHTLAYTQQLPDNDTNDNAANDHGKSSADIQCRCATRGD